MRPPARGAAAKGRSQFQLIVIALFSAALLGGFLLHRAPSVGHTGGLHTAHDDSNSDGGANRRELHLGGTTHTAVGSVTSTASVGESRVPSREGIPEAPQATVSAPPPHVLVGAHDARHPDNIKEMITGQSHAHEHRASVLETFIQGRFNSLLHLGGKKDQTADVKQAATGLKSGDTARQEAVVGGKATGADKLTVGTPAATTTTAATPKKGSVVASHAVKQVSGGPGTTAPGPGCKKAGAGCGLPGNTIHTLFTSNGSPYQNFQARIMVATWKAAKAQPGGAHMVAMTRILHRTTPDELMDEVDTFRADPLQPECDKWCWFPVADRANAFQQWLDATEKEPNMQKAPWLLLLETDYVWIKPLQVMGDAYDPKVPGLSFAFDYIGPRNNRYVEQMLKEECPTCDPATVPNSGPAPVLARFEDFKAATPLWEKLSKWIETHEQAKKALGWVREMYAWDIGVAAGRLNILNQGPPTTTLIAQPPHDFLPHNASMYHYTWGSIFKDEKGAEIWKFDKRSYVDPKDVYKVPHIPLPPPWKAGWKLHDGNAINKDLHATLSNMLELMNNASATLPDLTEHAAAVKKKQAALDAQAKAEAARNIVAKATTK